MTTYVERKMLVGTRAEYFEAQVLETKPAAKVVRFNDNRGVCTMEIPTEGCLSGTFYELRLVERD